MKYYIPTTTLNFNNILSSESISPDAFYKNRDFGYSRWYNIPENNQENSIILYDSLCNLKRPKSDMEDHPLIIEIETSETFKNIEKGVFITDKTIYLNPWNTWFRFLSEQDKRVAVSISDSSLETKMIPLYQKHFIVSQQEGPTFPMIKDNSGDLNFSAIQNDRAINKLKGLLYGYYIGSLLSCDAVDVKSYAIFKELYNISISILSDPLREGSDEQRKRVYALFEEINPQKRELDELINDDSKSIGLRRLLKKQRQELELKMRPEKLLDNLKYGEIENNSALKWISDELKKNNLKFEENKHLLYPNKKEIVIVENNLPLISVEVISDKQLNQLFIDLVRYVLSDESINGNIAAQRFELATAVTIQAKNTFGDIWEGSDAKVYLNALRKHIKGEEFKQNWDNGLLSSLAAVILKGDDWNGLLDFMKRKGMHDFRLAFAFYGLFNGFANLTRDFTDLLFCNDNKNYVAAVYSDIYESLHKEKIEQSTLIMDTDNISKNPIDLPYSPVDDKEIRKFFLEIRKGKNAQSQLEKELNEALKQLGSCRNPYIFVCVLNDFPKWGSKSNAWKEMKNRFCPDYDQIRQIRNSYPAESYSFKGSLYKETIWKFYNKEIKDPSSKDYLHQLAELRFVLEELGNCENPYVFVCVLNDSKLWKSDSEAWKKMQGRFCQNYDLIRGTVQNGNKNDSSTNLSGTLFEADPFDDYLPVRNPIEVPNSQSNISRIHFRIEEIDNILGIIKHLEPSLNETVLMQIRNDLAYTFTRPFLRNKSEQDFMQYFYSLLRQGKNNLKGRNGGDLSWKNKYYRTLDVEKIIKVLNEMILK